MRKKTLTIFTPVFNRRNHLWRLYQSIRCQTSQAFLWLIVDDGSTDQVQDDVRVWIDEGGVEIQYIYQEHQGKTAAMKAAVNACRTPWFICVDSDDTMPPSAVECMQKDMDSTLPPNGIGYIYPRNMLKQKRDQQFPSGLSLIHIMDSQYLYGIRETAILFQTEYLRKLDFPSFDGESFLSEEVLYIQIARYGKFVPINRNVYCSEYFDDGLTRNLFKRWMDNPKGTTLLLTKRYLFCGQYPFDVRVRERIKCILNLNAFCMACHMPVFRNTPSRWYSGLLYVPSVIWRGIRFV